MNDKPAPEMARAVEGGRTATMRLARFRLEWAITGPPGHAAFAMTFDNSKSPVVSRKLNTLFLTVNMLCAKSADARMVDARRQRRLQRGLQRVHASDCTPTRLHHAGVDVATAFETRGFCHASKKPQRSVTHTAQACAALRTRARDPVLVSSRLLHTECAHAPIDR
ncbi:hypothetical protein [Luteimonas sp. e5]